jgi:hypothetical protein
MNYLEARDDWKTHLDYIQALRTDLQRVHMRGESMSLQHGTDETLRAK